jgi:hypothetical protein
MVTEQQYQRLMKEYVKSGVLGTAAMKAGCTGKRRQNTWRGQRREIVPVGQRRETC